MCGRAGTVRNGNAGNAKTTGFWGGADREWMEKMIESVAADPVLFGGRCARRVSDDDKLRPRRRACFVLAQVGHSISGQITQRMLCQFLATEGDF
jgi:hypothetical protein